MSSISSIARIQLSSIFFNFLPELELKCLSEVELHAFNFLSKLEFNCLQYSSRARAYFFFNFLPNLESGCFQYIFKARAQLASIQFHSWS